MKNPTSASFNSVFCAAKCECWDLAIWDAGIKTKIWTGRLFRLVQHKYSKKFPGILSEKYEIIKTMETQKIVYYSQTWKIIEEINKRINCKNFINIHLSFILKRSNKINFAVRQWVGLLKDLHHQKYFFNFNLLFQNVWKFFDKHFQFFVSEQVPVHWLSFYFVLFLLQSEKLTCK